MMCLPSMAVTSRDMHSYRVPTSNVFFMFLNSFISTFILYFYRSCSGLYMIGQCFCSFSSLVFLNTCISISIDNSA